MIVSKMCSKTYIFSLSLYFQTLNYVLGSDQDFMRSNVENSSSDFLKEEALNLMYYHRNKMNEFLCKNYVASEIFHSLQNRNGENVEKRLGEPLKNSRLGKESLLTDPGSQKYKDWLSRSSTLEDIYRQFEHLEAEHPILHEAPHDAEGEVTGYALVDHKNHQYSKPVDYEPGDGHYVSVSPHSSYHDEEDEHEEKGMKLKELFHFALTAIAFLAFATFMTEVIMCLMETPTTTAPDYILMPTNTGTTGQASKIENEVPVINNGGRSLKLDSVPVEILNKMSSKVLSSIEALTIVHEDDGQCFRRALCKNSKYSKMVSGIQKIWLPIWSLGASWIGGKLSKNSRIINTLENLKAAVTGLGKKECQTLYPKCKGMSRKKRSTGTNKFL